MIRQTIRSRMPSRRNLGGLILTLLVIWGAWAGTTWLYKKVVSGPYPKIEWVNSRPAAIWNFVSFWDNASNNVGNAVSRAPASSNFTPEAQQAQATTRPVVQVEGTATAPLATGAAELQAASQEATPAPAATATAQMTTTVVVTENIWVQANMPAGSGVFSQPGSAQVTTIPADVPLTLAGTNAARTWGAVANGRTGSWDWFDLSEATTIQGDLSQLPIIDFGFTSNMGAAPPPASITATGPMTVTVLSEQLNIRCGSGRDYDSIGIANKDTVFTVLAKNGAGTWWQVAYQQNFGWISGGTNYTRLSGDPKGLPISTETNCPVIADMPASPPITTTSALTNTTVFTDTASKGGGKAGSGLD